VTPLSDILLDYSNSAPDIREAEVLSLFSVVFERLTPEMLDLVPSIIKSIFDSTINMISTDFNSYPDHRQNFFEFIKTTVTHAFLALFNMHAD
jgi:exportin-1